MNDPTYSIEKIEAHQYLSRYLFHDVYWQSLAIEFFEDLPQVNAQYFEDHAKMIPVRSFIEESIEKVKYVSIISIVFLLGGFIFFERLYPLGMKCVFGYFLKNLNLVIRRL
jgi:hypothetical protein